VTDLAISRLRLQREQHVPGWCVLLLRRHVREPHELPAEERIAFFEDMVRVGRALEQVYAAQKINYSILRNIVPHPHAHIRPRYHGDAYPGGPVSPAPVMAKCPSGSSRFLREVYWVGATSSHCRRLQTLSDLSLRRSPGSAVRLGTAAQ
jgi:diadenosine tetraphosphate (Ap4A) HIT family hydrolase